MNEENNNINVQKPDAVTNNPYAFQKITSKRLEIVKNAQPVEKKKNKLPKAVFLIFFIITITALVLLYFEIIYPTYIKKYYNQDNACNITYECKDLGNGTSRCSFFDDRDQLQYTICKNKKSEETTTKVVEETSDLSKTQVNKVLINIKNSIDVAFPISTFKNTNDILTSSRDKFEYMFTYLVLTGKSDYVKKTDEGYLIDYTFFKEKYIVNFNEDFDSKVLNDEEIIENGYIFSSLYNDQVNKEYVFKTREISFNDDLYTIVVDVLDYSNDIYPTKDEELGTEEYDNTKIVYSLTITLFKDNDNYYMKSIKKN